MKNGLLETRLEVERPALGCYFSLAGKIVTSVRVIEMEVNGFRGSLKGLLMEQV